MLGGIYITVGLGLGGSRKGEVTKEYRYHTNMIAVSEHLHQISSLFLLNFKTRRNIKVLN
jgi:hypothetical protein